MPLPLSKLCRDYENRIAVFRAINRPIADMKVNEICGSVGISRKRFYALFGSKEDVFRWYLDLCFEASLYEIGRSLSWDEGLLACLNYIADERNVFEASYRGRTAPASRYWPMQRKRVDEMMATCKAKDILIDETLRLEMNLYSGNIPQLIQQWVESNGSVPAIDFAAYWLDCVPGRLRKALE